MEKRELKLSLEQLRLLINPDIIKINNYRDINCYAYALGLDIRESEILNNAYEPGTISGANKLKFKEFTYEELLYWIYEDLKLLNIEFSDTYPNEQVDINEWKIALFTEKLYKTPYSEYLSDYHFLRQYKNGIWYHKIGWDSYPTNKDSDNKIIEDIENCNIKYYTYKKCLKLKLK